MIAETRAHDQRDVATPPTQTGSFVADDGIRVSFYRRGIDGTQLRVAFHDGFAADTETNRIATQASRMFDQTIEPKRIAAETLVPADDMGALAVHPERLATAIPRAQSITMSGDHLGGARQPGFIAAAIEFPGH